MALKALPAAAFTASVIFDVLALVADTREQAHTYERGAADLLRMGLGSSLASVALEVADYMRAPAAATSAPQTRKFAINGAIIVVYLLDLAARQQRAGDVRAGHTRVDGIPIGLSLLGLACLGVSAKLD